MLCIAGIKTGEAQLSQPKSSRIFEGDTVLQMGLIRHLRVQIRRSVTGQTMAEYALILLAVAVIVYASYQTFGTTISSDLTSVNKLF